MTSRQLAAALLVVLTIIIIARALRRRADKYRVGSPAEPRQREMANDLRANLKTIVGFGKRFEQQAASLNDAEKSLLTEKKANALVAVVKSLNGPMEQAEKTLGSIRPTYANYASVYSALIGDDADMKKAADMLITAGRNIHQQIGFSQAEGASMNTLGGAGDNLIAMGTNIRCLPASEHRLGVALDLE